MGEGIAVWSLDACPVVHGDGLPIPDCGIYVWDVLLSLAGLSLRLATTLWFKVKCARF